MNVTDKEFNVTINLPEARAFLSDTGWLSERPRFSRELILRKARLVRYDEGEPVCLMGDTGDGIYGFVNGGMRIMLPRDDDEVVPIHISEPGFWVGDSPVISSQPHLVSLIPTRPTVGVFIPESAVAELLADHPELIHDFYALAHRNLATVMKLLANLTIANSTSRVAQRLLYYDSLSGTRGDPIDVIQEDLAELVAVSLPTLERALRALVKEGAIRTARRQIQIVDRKRLTALSFG